MNDGAAALVVMGADIAAKLNLKPIARVVGYATAGLEPMLVMMTPVEAVRKLNKKTGWKMDDAELVELNEAFSVQAVAVMKELGLDPARVNVQGGAVALGHPIGASGARILTTLLYSLKRQGKKRGIATLCLGGGNGVAMAVEMSVMIKYSRRIGAGTMGNGIAQVFAQNGFDVKLHDASAPAIDKAVATIEKSLGKFVEKGKLIAGRSRRGAGTAGESAVHG